MYIKAAPVAAPEGEAALGDCRYVPVCVRVRVKNSRDGNRDFLGREMRGAFPIAWGRTRPSEVRICSGRSPRVPRQRNYKQR